MYASLAALAALPGDTRVYCAHEYTQANLRFARAAEPDNKDLIRREAEVAATRERGAPTVPSELALELATQPVPALRGARSCGCTSTPGKMAGGEALQRSLPPFDPGRTNFDFFKYKQLLI